MPKQLMYVSHKTNEVMTGREARKRYRKRYAADPKLKYFDVSYYAQDQHLRVKGYQARHSRSP